MTTAIAPSPASRTRLQCMEVWGGNETTQSGASLPGLDVWLISRTYRNQATGGDIYYVSTCGSGHIARVILADVAGHGERVSEVSRLLRQLMRKYINTPKQTRFARALNRKFNTMASVGDFATAALATYFSPTGRLAVCNAGHPAPLWYRSERNSWQLMDERESDTDAGDGAVARNLPLGIDAPTPYREIEVPFGAGDILVLYSDGLTEAAAADGEQLTPRGLLNIAAASEPGDAPSLAKQIWAGVEAFSASDDPADDGTLMVVTHNGNKPRASMGAMAKTVAKMMGFGQVYRPVNEADETH